MYTADELEIRCALAGSPRAEQLIACLEGEIAKRDARILELESQYQRDVFGLNNEGDPIGGDPAGGYANDNARLRTELAAIKAQEPVAEIALSDDGYKIGLLGALRNHRLPIGTKLYAAPVSEAKALGVVMPERKTKADYGVYIDEFADEAAAIYNAALDEVARLNAAPVQQVSVPDDSDNIKHITECVDDDCERCDNLLRFYQTCDECGSVGHNDAPCRCSAAPVQQVSVPDERIIPTSAELIQWALEEEPEETRFQEGYNAAKRWVKMQIEAGIAAPAAPAADAGCVLEQAMYTLISIGYHENSGLVHELRQALAAHRAK